MEVISAAGASAGAGAGFCLAAGVEELIQFRFVEAGGFQRNLPDGFAGFVSNLGDFGGFVVADDRRERGAHGEAVFDVAFAFGNIGFEAGDATPRKYTAAGGEQFDGLQQIVGDDGQHDVQFEIAESAAEGDGGVVAR